MPKTVVITGCSSGFGRQLALNLARRGDRVFATMRGTKGKNAVAAEELAEAATREGLDLNVLELDVTSTASVEAAAADILAEAGAPDAVINNAGVMLTGFTEAFTAEEMTNQLDVNVVGIHRMNRAFLPAMRQRGRGLIINLSSIAGRLSAPFFGVYHASKWAVEGYSMALRGELACCGVDVVVVERDHSPPPCLTPAPSQQTSTSAWLIIPRSHAAPSRGSAMPSTACSTIPTPPRIQTWSSRKSSP